MKKMLAVEPVAPMSAINIELEILDQRDDKILSKNWRGEFIQLTPSMVKDNRTIYRIEDSNIDISKLKFGWVLSGENRKKGK